MGYWFKCFPQLDAEKYYFISPSLGQSNSSCEREKEASLHSGEGEKRERKEWQSDDVWSRATYVAEAPKQAEGGPTWMLSFCHSSLYQFYFTLERYKFSEKNIY